MPKVMEPTIFDPCGQGLRDGLLSPPKVTLTEQAIVNWCGCSCSCVAVPVADAGWFVMIPVLDDDNLNARFAPGRT